MSLDHTQLDSSVRVISSSQKPLPTQHATNTRNEHPIPSAGFKPAIHAIERPQNYASERRATGIGSVVQLARIIAFILAVEDKLVMFIMQILTGVKMCLDTALVMQQQQFDT